MIIARTISFLILIAIGVESFASDGPYKPYRKYNIQDMGVDSTLNKGEVKFEGFVLVKGALKNGVLVSTDSRANEVRTDEDGRYVMIIQPPAPTVQIVCKAKGFKETVIQKMEFKLGHRYTLNFYFQDNYGSGNMTVKKPVIYLYSDQKREIEIDLQPKAALSFSYPEIEDDWKFTLDKDGITAADGRSFPYLFWEAENASLSYDYSNDRIYGSVVSQKELIPFFESKLTELGLNQGEQADFITFWGPIMSQHEDCFVQFFIDDDYVSKIADIKVVPEPEASRRIYMLFTPMDQMDLGGLNIVEQKFNQFERSGYTLVEWGGSELLITDQP